MLIVTNAHLNEQELDGRDGDGVDGGLALLTGGGHGRGSCNWAINSRRMLSFEWEKWRG